MAVQYISNSGLTASTTVGSITPPAANNDDLYLLMIETQNQPIAENAISGWAFVPNSTINNTNVSLQIFYKWRTQSSDGNSFNLPDSGDHTTGVISVWRGVDKTNPFNAIQSISDSGSDTSCNFPSVTTTVDNAMIVNIAGLDRNATTTGIIDSWSNSSLVSITERFDATSTVGNGGGIAFAEGIKSSAGVVNETTATKSTADFSVYITLALSPIPEAPAYSGSASISQASTIAGTGTTARSGSASVSQASSFVASGSVALSGSVAITQASSVEATGVKYEATADRYGDVAISQSSTVEASATGAKNGSTAILTSSEVGTTGTKQSAESSAIAQDESVAVSGAKSVSGDASVSQASTVQATGTKYEPTYDFTGDVSVSQSSSIGAMGKKTVYAFCVVEHESSNETTGTKGGLGAFSVSQGNTIYVSPYPMWRAPKHTGTVKRNGTSSGGFYRKTSAQTVVFGKGSSGTVGLNKVNRKEIKLK